MSLKVGDSVPKFELLNQHGEVFKSETVIGKILSLYIFIQRTRLQDVFQKPAALEIIMKSF